MAMENVTVFLYGGFNDATGVLVVREIEARKVSIGYLFDELMPELDGKKSVPAGDWRVAESRGALLQQVIDRATGVAEQDTATIQSAMKNIDFAHHLIAVCRDWLASGAGPGRIEIELGEGDKVQVDEEDIVHYCSDCRAELQMVRPSEYRCPDCDYCSDCGAEFQVVRPGKFQCPNCA